MDSYKSIPRWAINPAVALLLLLLFHCATALAASSPKLLRTIDLKKDLCDLKWRQTNSPMAGVDFISEDEVLIYTVCHTGVAFSSRDGFQPTNPYHLRAVILDTQTGEVERHFDWPTHGLGSSVHVTHSGDLLLYRDNVLELLTRDGNPLEGLRIDKLGLYDATYVWISSPQDILAFSTIPDSAKPTLSLVAILDSRNLHTLHSWKDDADKANIAASSTMSLRIASRGSQLIAIKYGESTTTPLWTESNQSIFRPVFINDSEFAVPTGHGLLFFGAAGNVTATFPSRTPLKTTVSRNGQVLAESWGSSDLNKTEGDLPVYTDAGINIYGTSPPQPITSLTLKDPEYGVDVALSPAGSRLAVVDRLNLSIFEIPRDEK